MDVRQAIKPICYIVCTELGISLDRLYGEIPLANAITNWAQRFVPSE